MEESAPFGEPSQEDMLYDKLMDAYNKSEENLAEVMGVSMSELDDEINEWCRENGKHADDDRDEAIQGVIEDTVHNADFKDHGGAMYDEALAELKKLAGLV